MTNKDRLESLRVNYYKDELLKSEVAEDPMEQFDRWFQEWLERSDAPFGELNAFTLATANKAGQPSARIVLLKSYDAGGFVFYTNYNSRKGRDIAENNKVGMNFFWPTLERQVAIRGTASKTAPLVSDEYFNARPRGNQIGAMASSQSSVVPNREYLEKEFESLEAKYEGQPIKRPEYWGGYMVRPSYFEFWQGRENRLHDRIGYSTGKDGKWEIFRLAP